MTCFRFRLPLQRLAQYNLLFCVNIVKSITVQKLIPFPHPNRSSADLKSSTANSNGSGHFDIIQSLKSELHDLASAVNQLEALCESYRSQADTCSQPD
ncbi:hypothetical protein AM571_PB00165 (plasmid) [Rhizobium etli 8C-3]|uniref:Uncharacterized protein n=1 Tax=Rhizobium etli 8C-3 TaxID=538025 RepID=A0A1L5PBS0_RHIET|nr:hypothetical protein AM571_PB00165 [Rhizobium etli 8C-3]ARM14860.1 hypothetical protein Bra5_PB00109 [Rhizobium phaseoli Brasil 5]